jgi:hypothetical protein
MCYQNRLRRSSTGASCSIKVLLSKFAANATTFRGLTIPSSWNAESAAYSKTGFMTYTKRPATRFQKATVPSKWIYKSMKRNIVSIARSSAAGNRKVASGRASSHPSKQNLAAHEAGEGRPEFFLPSGSLKTDPASLARMLAQLQPEPPLGILTPVGAIQLQEN